MSPALTDGLFTIDVLGKPLFLSFLINTHGLWDVTMIVVKLLKWEEFLF